MMNNLFFDMSQNSDQKLEKKLKILCTGGAGYIGGHTVINLIENGYNVDILDNLSNSSFKSLECIKRCVKNDIFFHNIDLCNYTDVKNLFLKEKYDGVLHFAGLKIISESLRNPLNYYENNVCGTVTLLKVMKEVNCKLLVFSSTAAVYMDSDELIDESSTVMPLNPYGKTKLIIEGILQDIFLSDNSWRIIILRYFNPIGAHRSGKFGEFYSSSPSNIFPYIELVASGKKPFVEVFGNDWPTADGTGIRDFIHIEDLACGHVAAFKKILNSMMITGDNSDCKEGFCEVYNLGRGEGVSVLELIKCFENSCGISVPYKFVPRRLGDLSKVVADPSKAERELGWKAKKTIMDGCKSSWAWSCQYYKDLIA